MAVNQMQPAFFASALDIEPRKDVDAEVSSASTNEPAGRSRADSTESLESVELESLESLEAQWQRCQAEQATPCTPMMAVSYILAVMPDGRQCWMPMAMPAGVQMGAPMAMPMSMAMTTPIAVPTPDVDGLTMKASALRDQVAAARAAAKQARAAARAVRSQARADERRQLRTLLSELRRRKLAGELYPHDESTFADAGSEADASSFEDDGSESAFDL